MSLQQRRPGKPARSQSDVLTRSRLREMNGDPDAGGRDAYDDERRAATATRRSSASQASARSYSNKGASDSGAGDRRGSASSSAAAVPALDESALTALISLAAGAMKRFVKDEAFRTSLRAGCASCLGDSNHRAVLDLRVHAQTVERAAREDLDPRDLKRASLKLHEVASLDAVGADAVTANVLVSIGVHTHPASSTSSAPSGVVGGWGRSPAWSPAAGVVVGGGGP